MPKSNKRKKQYKNAPLFIIAYVAFAGILIVMTIVNINIYTNKTKVLSASVDLDAEEQFWKDVIKRYPSYKDAYIELGGIYAQLGNESEAQTNFNKAIKLDPNSQKTFEVIKTLSSY